MIFTGSVSSGSRSGCSTCEGSERTRGAHLCGARLQVSRAHAHDSDPSPPLLTRFDQPCWSRSRPAACSNTPTPTHCIVCSSERCSLRRWQNSTQRRRPQSAGGVCGGNVATDGHATEWQVVSGRNMGADSCMHCIASVWMWIQRAVQCMLMFSRAPGAVWWARRWWCCSAFSTLAAVRRVFYGATACRRDVRVMSLVVNSTPRARVVMSPVVAVVAAMCRNELSQLDGAAC